MNKESKEEKVNLIAETIQHLILQIDIFVNSMTIEDIDILLESKELLQNKISRNESAMALILAIGGDYDSTEDRMKVDTLDCLIKLIRIRNQYKEEMLKRQKEIKAKKEALKLFGL